MANNTASVGGLTFSLKADAGQLKQQLDSAAKDVQSWKQQTDKTLAKKPGGGAAPTPKTRTTADSLEAFKKIGQGGMGSSDAIIGLARISPAAAGVVAAFGGLTMAAKGAMTAFEEWEKNGKQGRITGGVVAGSLLTTAKEGIADAASEVGGMAAEFALNLFGGLGEAERRRLKVEQEIAAHNARMAEQAKKRAEEAAKQKKLSEAQSAAARHFIGQFKEAGDSIKMYFARQLIEGLPKTVKDDMLRANTASLATYGSAEEISALDAEDLRIQQKNSEYLRTIAKGGNIKVVAF